MKATISELVCFGGTPLFKDAVHVGRPNIGNREILKSRLNGVIERRWLTNYGPLVQEFESKIASYIGVKHCIVMCNATVALEIAIRALGLKGEVIVPAFTFVATAHALQWQEITPVFCDIRPDNFIIDPDKIEPLITPRTTGIIGVHLWGRSCDTDAIESIARARNLKVIYDAAHAFGCTHKGRRIGCFGNAEVFSFHATKFLNSLEGGAVVTNDDTLANKIRLMQNFGFDGYDSVVYIGTNGKMNEFSAAMGLTNLEHVESIILKNFENYKIYASLLSDIPGVKLIEFPDCEKYNYQYITTSIDERITGITTEAIVKILHKENILVRRYFYPGCHCMEPYRSYFPHAKLLLPITEKYSSRVISFPTGTAINNCDIEKISGILKFIIAQGSEISSKLKPIKII